MLAEGMAREGPRRKRSQRRKLCAQQGGVSCHVERKGLLDVRLRLYDDIYIMHITCNFTDAAVRKLGLCMRIRPYVRTQASCVLLSWSQMTTTTYHD